MPDADIIIDRDNRGFPLPTDSTASFSPCRTYRYTLTRWWNLEAPPAVFVMLNPSTADAFTDDPTIRRVVGFAKSWDCGGLIVVNAFALRSPHPSALRTHPAPIGARNDEAILRAVAATTGPVVVAWGAHAGWNGRDVVVTALLRAAGVKPVCLGLTKTGQPRHPLYVRSDTPLVPYQKVVADA